MSDNTYGLELLTRNSYCSLYSIKLLMTSDIVHIGHVILLTFLPNFWQVFLVFV